MSQLRTLIAAVENDEAVEVETSSEPKLGLHHEVARRFLGSDDVNRILTRERDELADAASHYRELGVVEELGTLEARLRIVARYID